MSAQDRVRRIPAVGPLRYLRRIVLSRSSGTPEYFAREQRKRSHPVPTDSNWLILRERNRIFGPWFARWIPRDATVLDVGGAIQPYRRLITSEPLNYIGLDRHPTPYVDVVADAMRLPILDDSVDAVICTAVLQYVGDPNQAMSEMYRVLRPGGTLFLSITALAPMVEPQDRWRFPSTGIPELVSKFSDVEIVPEGGRITAVLVLCLISLARHRTWRAVSKPITLFLNLVGLGLAKAAPARDNAISWGHSVRARKSSHDLIVSGYP